MRFLKMLLLMVIVSFISTGCATRTMKVGGGWSMALGVETNSVIVINSTSLPGDLFLNNGFVTTIQAGDVPFQVNLGAFVKDNVLTFRTFTVDAENKKVAQGYATKTARGGAGRYNDPWKITYVQPIR